MLVLWRAHLPEARRRLVVAFRRFFSDKGKRFASRNVAAMGNCMESGDSIQAG
jgi:hypothetical protein